MSLTSIFSSILLEVKVKSEERIKFPKYDMVLDGHTYTIEPIVPLTHTASCKYGADSKWCTAVPSNNQHFKSYTEKGLLVYFLIIEQGHLLTKFAMEVNDKSFQGIFWDMEDKPINLTDDTFESRFVLRLSNTESFKEMMSKLKSIKSDLKEKKLQIE